MVPFRVRALIGGRNARIARSTCEIFNGKTKTWKTGPQLNEPRIGSRSILEDGKIYVVGGGAKSVEFIPKNGENTRWTLMEPRMNARRFGLGLAWFNGGFFVVGGQDPTSDASSEYLKAANCQGNWESRILENSGPDHFVYFGNLVIC